MANSPATSITVQVPATVSNVGPGFDIFGFALDFIGEELRLTATADGAVTLAPIRYDGWGKPGSVPADPEKNIATHTVRQALQRFGIRQGVHVEMSKRLPIGSGLGGSACSAAAAAAGVNALFELKLSDIELLDVALQGEKLSSVSEHLDNLAPCLLGGFALVRSVRPIDVIKIPPPPGLHCAVVLPDHVILTREARRVLPAQVPLSSLVHQTAHAASLVAALYAGDFALLRRAIDDRVVEPVRAKLLPGFDAAKAAAFTAGALGCSISGSGPAVFAFAESREAGERIAAAMTTAFQQAGKPARSLVSGIAAQGARVIA